MTPFPHNPAAGLLNVWYRGYGGRKIPDKTKIKMIAFILYRDFLRNTGGI